MHDFLWAFVHVIGGVVILLCTFTASLCWWSAVEFFAPSLRDTWLDKILSYPVTVAMRWL